MTIVREIEVKACLCRQAGPAYHRIFSILVKISPMRIKDFFRLAIKLFGLYALIFALFTVFPQMFAYVVSVLTGSTELYSILWTVGVGGALLSFYLFLVFQPDWTIRKLKLDKNFDSEQIEFGALDPKALLGIGIILIGGFIIIENVGLFLSNSFYFVKSIVATSDEVRMLSAHEYDTKRFVLNLLNIIIGYLLITNFRFLSNMLLSKKEEDQHV